MTLETVTEKRRNREVKRKRGYVKMKGEKAVFSDLSLPVLLSNVHLENGEEKKKKMMRR